MYKRICTPEEAVADVPDEAVVMFGGFARPGLPEYLISALINQGPQRLTTISNSAYGRKGTSYGVARLVEEGMVAKCITSFPVWPSQEGDLLSRYREGKLEVEIVPQGTLSERMRAAGSGIPGFWVRTGVDTLFEEGKEKRKFGNQVYLLERALHADFAMIKAKQADTFGNLVYDMTQRNHNPTMASAGKVTIVEVEEIVDAGELNPEAIVTPGIFVDRIVPVGGKKRQ